MYNFMCYDFMIVSEILRVSGNCRLYDDANLKLC